MSEAGVFAVDRGIFLDPDFADEPFTEREAFLWLVSEAAWKDYAKRAHCGRVELKRGEVCHSVRFMAAAWKWSKSRVDRYLKKAISRGMLSVENRDSQQIYFICNYNKFQRVSIPERDSCGTAAGQQRDKLEDIKNIKDNNSSLRSESVGSAVVGDHDKDRSDIIEAFDAYNVAAASTGWPKAAKLTPPRRSALKARIADAGGLAGWIAAIDRAKLSPLLTGQNERGWRADFDFFLQAKSFTKLIEGSYDPRVPAGQPAPASPDEERAKIRAYWAKFDIARETKPDPAKREDWGDMLKAWFQAESWLSNRPNPRNPQCDIPREMVDKYADKYGWDAPMCPRLPANVTKLRGVA